MMGGSGPTAAPSTDGPPPQAPPGPTNSFPQQPTYRGQGIPPQQAMPQSKWKYSIQGQKIIA